MIKDARILEALITKRAGLVGMMIEGTQMSLRQMIADLDALDATIRVFDPDMDLEEVRPKALPPRHAGFKGELVRAVMKTVREARALGGSPDRNPDHGRARSIDGRPAASPGHQAARGGLPATLA